MRFAAALSALLLAVLPASAASMRLEPVDRKLPHLGALAIYVNGTIEEGDTGRLLELLAEQRASGRPFFGVILNSVGGSLREGVALGRAVRAAGLDTFVFSESVCASACVVALAGGVRRAAYRGARIGVHGAAINGQETPEALAATTLMARIVADLGAPDSVLGKMVRTPASSIAWLTPEEIVAVVGPDGYYDRTAIRQ